MLSRLRPRDSPARLAKGVAGCHAARSSAAVRPISAKWGSVRSDRRSAPTPRHRPPAKPLARERRVKAPAMAATGGSNTVGYHTLPVSPAGAAGVPVSPCSGAVDERQQRVVPGKSSRFTRPAIPERHRRRPPGQAWNGCQGVCVSGGEIPGHGSVWSRDRRAERPASGSVGAHA